MLEFLSTSFIALPILIHFPIFPATRTIKDLIHFPRN